MDYLWPAIAVCSLALVLGAGWLMTLMALPGTWLIVVATAAYAYFVPDAWRIDISWGVWATVLALAVLGEIIESAAVAVGAKRAGGSRRAALLALCGSIGGGLLGGILGLPIPVIGSVIAIVLGASCGATAGAMLGEHWKGRTMQEGWAVGRAAFWGRLIGTLGKIGTVTAMVALVIAAMVLR
jgi:uncharacterized protein YqgC (DUF456 family)